MTEFVLEQRLRQIRKRGNTVFPMIENKKYLLRTWYTHIKDQIKLELISGYGLNETKIFYSLEKENADVFFSKMGFGKHIEKPEKVKKQREKKVNYSLHTHKPNRHYAYNIRMSDTTENNIASLRTHLFSAIQKLEGGTMKHEEAKAMASLAQTIINSAKLELDYKRMVEKTPDIKMLNS